MHKLNSVCVLVLAFLCFALAGCTNGTGGYAPWASAPQPPAEAGPNPLSSAQVQNGSNNINLGQNAQTITGVSIQQQPMTGFDTPDQANAKLQQAGQMPAPIPAAAPIKVAILLPLSGKDAALGNAMLQAAQMALFDVGQNAFQLLPRDTATGARAAAQTAIAEGAKLILGPVFSNDVRETKQVAQAAGINMISFSTDWTQAGGNTFIMGFMPFDQVSRVLNYAASKGLHHVGIIAPGTQYGNAVVSAFRSRNPAIVPSDVLMLPNSTAALPTALQNFVQQSAMPFDGVMIPIGGTNAGTIGDLLTQNGLTPDRVKRLGTGLWEDTSLASVPGLANGWFAAPAPQQRAKFESRYRDLYAATPPRLASLAYDATALAAVLANGNQAFNRTAITNPNGFSGVDGIFRFRNDGLAERGLAVLELRNGQIAVLDDAPKTFQH